MKKLCVLAVSSIVRVRRSGHRAVIYLFRRVPPRLGESCTLVNEIKPAADVVVCLQGARDQGADNAGHQTRTDGAGK